MTFLPSGRTFDVTVGSTLLKAVVRAGLPIGRSCRGTGICAACKVRIVDGAANVDPMNPVERALAAREPLGDDERYACLAHLRGDVTITTGYW